MLLKLSRCEVFELVSRYIVLWKTIKFHLYLHVCEIAESINANNVRVALLRRVWVECFQPICRVRRLIKIIF